MDFMTTFKICGSGMAAQRAKLDVVTSNLANVNTTRTPEGGPYKKKSVTLASEVIDGGFGSAIGDALRSVKVDSVTEAPNATKMVHDPSHPDANNNGYVEMPDVNVMTEMADLIVTSRSYEACVTAFDSAKNMALKTLDIGR